MFHLFPRFICLVFVIILLVSKLSGETPSKEDPIFRNKIHQHVIVKEKATGAAVPGANLLLDGNMHDAASNADGVILIEVASPGWHSIEIEKGGYLPTLSAIEISSDHQTPVLIELIAENVASEEVTVTPGFSILQDSGGNYLSRNEVRRLPVLADDLYRALKNLPGIAAGDISAKFNVRGGEQDEVSVILDGLSIDYPFHLKDFQSVFSTIDSEAVDSVDVLTASFPAEYGGKMSAVIDLSSSVAKQDVSTSVGLSFINLRFMSEGLFNENRGNWLLSVRRGYLDMVLPLLDPGSEAEFDPVYYDVLGKVELHANDTNVLSGHMLAAYDSVHFANTGSGEFADAVYHNQAFWLNWKSQITERFYMVNTFSATSFDQERSGQFENVLSSTGAVSDVRSSWNFGWKQDSILNLNPSQRIKWGITGHRFTTNYDYRSISRFNEFARAPLRSISEENIKTEPAGSSFGAYISHQFHPIQSLTLETGLRYDRQSFSNDNLLSPRLNTLISAGKTQFRAGWGLFYQPQGIHELQVADGVTNFFKAQRAEHRTFGVERFLTKAVQLRTEIYQKRISNLRPRYENLFSPIELFPEALPDRIRIEPEYAESRGIEFLIRSSAESTWDWWISYAWSRVTDQVNGIDVVRSWDQTHALQIDVNYQATNKWNINASWQYHTGWPTTPAFVEEIQSANGKTLYEPYLGDRNSARLPDFHRLDVRVSRSIPFHSGSFLLFVEVMNLYNRDNACCISNFDFVQLSDGTPIMQAEYNYWLPLVPSFGLSWQF